MSTTKRRSRRQRENRDPITLAWDEGLPPPREAFAPENHEHVQEVIFWRWCEADVETYGSRDKQHPHQGEWLAALRGERASLTGGLRAMDSPRSESPTGSRHASDLPAREVYVLDERVSISFNQRRVS